MATIRNMREASEAIIPNHTSPDGAFLGRETPS
jgi:hypothetical protein